MENLFKIMDCPDQYKVPLATYQFEEEVEYWWGTVKPREGEEPITWERLRAVMDNQYYRRDVQRTNEREFLSHSKGT